MIARTRAPRGGSKRPAIRPSTATSASAQSRSIVIVAGGMVRVPRQASTNLRDQVLSSGSGKTAAPGRAKRRIAPVAQTTPWVR